MSTYRREHYLAKLRPFYNDSGLIKVITGIRRCGKSSLLITVLNELFEQGIPETNLIYLNLDRREYRNVTTPDQLDQLIEQAMSNAYGAGLRYLFIDEVQNVKGFETVINGWREEGNCSIFITGSNSYLLSGELATKLTGRYIKLEMFTLSFQEYLGMRNFLNKPEIPVSQAFRDYLTYGGFPKSLEYDDPDAKAAYIQDVIGQIFNKDITAHKKVRNRDTFTRVQDYLINNFAAPTNLSGIIAYLKHSEGISIKRETLASYVRLLESAKILYKCPRFDLKSRKSLTAQYLNGTMRIEVPATRRKGNGKTLTVHGARAHNLRNVTASIPLGTFTCITGVSGSGKSSFTIDTLYAASARALNGALSPRAPSQGSAPVATPEASWPIRAVPRAATPATALSNVPIGRSVRTCRAAHRVNAAQCRRCASAQ